MLGRVILLIVENMKNFRQQKRELDQFFISSKDMVCVTSEPAYISYIAGHFWTGDARSKRKVGIYLGDSLIYGVEKSERAMLFMTKSGEILPIEVKK